MQYYPYKPLSTVWLKAAVMGSLWASFEIIVGSFLHNLRIPFSGTTLTFASVFLVIAFIQFWNDKGLVWRAGLICALMKSLSPSAVIIGPMVGILTEAIIIEFFIRTTGRNLVSFMIAGALAVASALFHKVISLLILYGFDLVKILEGIYHFAIRQLGITKLDPVQLLIVLVTIYLLAGIVAAVMGYFTGRKFKNISIPPGLQENIPLENSFSHFSISGHHRYSITLLFSHLIIIILCLFMINSGQYFIYIPLCILYLVICFFRYKKSLRYFKKISFWIYFIIITFVAAFLLEGYSSGKYFSMAGLIIGLKMNLRAFVIMVGFTAISTELKNPLIRSILYNRGFSSVYQSLNLAFSALPGIIAGMPKSNNLFSRRSSLLAYIFNHSRLLLEQFKEDHFKLPPVIILTGDIGQGKTTFAKNLIDKLISQGIKVDGFYSAGVHENEQRVGFDLVEISTGQSIIISRKTPQPGWIRQGRYYFDPSAFQKGGEKLLDKTRDGTLIIVIDEIGPLELNNSGWSPTIERICMKSSITMFWVVRKSLVQRVARKWNVGDVFIFDMETDKEETILHEIRRLSVK